MSDPNPKLAPAGSPIVNETRLEATNSQIDNASQVVNSPGAVVTQVQIDQGSSATGILAGILGVLLLLLVAALRLLGNLIPSGLSFALAGLSCWLIVGGFFSWVENLLNSSTKSEIAVWLVGVRLGQMVEPWPDTFAKVFDRVFGNKALSLGAFGRSYLASICTLAFVIIVNALSLKGERRGAIEMLAAFPLQVFVNIVPDFVSVSATRRFIGVLRNRPTATRFAAVLLAALMVGVLMASVSLVAITTVRDNSSYASWYDKFSHAPQIASVLIKQYFPDHPEYRRQFVEAYEDRVLVEPAIFASLLTSIWLWLYAGAGFLLKAARRFDIGFQWFNATFDIEKKPLQAIGLVAGALVALIYWGWAIVSRVL